MKDCEKMIIVFYVNIGGIDESDISAFMQDFASNFTFDKTVRAFYIPVRGIENSKVEVYNSKRKFSFCRLLLKLFIKILTNRLEKK